MLSSVFNSNEDIEVLSNRFLKKLKGCVAMNFKKVRITRKKKPSKTEELHERMTSLKTKTDLKSKREVEGIVKEIANIHEENYEKLKEDFDKVKSNKGGMNAKQIWKMKKKLCPRSKDPPTAMLDSKGIILMSDKAIQNRANEVKKALVITK